MRYENVHKRRYALEAVADLALHAREGTVSIRAISGRRGISDNYLEQIFLQLRKAGLLHSVRGPQGGYRLAVDPTTLTAWDIVSIVEERMSPVQCPEPGEPANAAAETDARPVWSGMACSGSSSARSAR
jgi:Rrf2 family protein